MQRRRLFAFFAARAHCWLMVERVVHQDFQVLFWRAAFHLVGSQCVLMHGVVPTQEQDIALAFVELHEVLVSSFLQPVKVPLSTPLRCIIHFSRF